ncbi:MAG: L-rhamnose isomerase [Gemmatimonadota bacterium]|nr:L-rhamnose isomerase [Gemmatimonadota bacterium]
MKKQPDLELIKDKGLDYLRAAFGEPAVERAIECTMSFAVEVPGWQFWEGFGGGGRFGQGGTGGAARTTGEIAEDAGLVHRLTRATPVVGQHILWFFSDDGMTGDFEIAARVKEELVSNGVQMGSVSPTYFLAGSEDGSLTAQDPAVRERYIEQTVLGAQVAAELASGIVTLWFPDGTNYPGQRVLQDKTLLIRDSLEVFWDRLPEDHKDRLNKVLIEYKVFEPGTYSTTVPDWGIARELSRLFGHKGGVLVDMGHHHHGTNIEQIVGALIAFQVTGGFHFNTRYAADDDHAVQADYEMARVFGELLAGGVLCSPDLEKNWMYGLDQMARTEQRIPAVLKSVDALKRSVAKAVLLDTDKLERKQGQGDLIGANSEFERALLHADTGPLVMEAYARQGLHPVPLVAYQESGYQERIEKERN